MTAAYGDNVGQEERIFYTDKGYNLSVGEEIKVTHAKEKFKLDITTAENKINDFLIDKSIALKQNEFDALMIARYQAGSLSQTLMEYLKSNNRNKEDWRQALNAMHFSPGFDLVKRTEFELSIFFDDNWDVNRWFNFVGGLDYSKLFD